MDDEIDHNRINPAEKGATVRTQFNAWAGELFPGAQANVQKIDKTDMVRLELRISDMGDWRRPSNIGYGLTYAFPIIVAGLIAKPGQMLIIGSPEAHLHPLGQSKMGQFLAKVASAGIQIILETHSDHILNGIRLAVKEKILSPDQAAIHFFTQPNNVVEENQNIITPSLDDEGNLDIWPEGFFDQSEKDTAKLLGWT